MTYPGEKNGFHDASDKINRDKLILDFFERTLKDSRAESDRGIKLKLNAEPALGVIFLIDKIAGPDIECLGNIVEHVEGSCILFALEITHVGAVDTSVVRQSFLAEPADCTKTFHVAGEECS
jgi:hypothetical protein